MIVLHAVLVATDFSAPSDAALTYGRALARTFNAKLHVLHVLENSFLRATFADRHTVETSHRKWLDDRVTADDRTELAAHAVIAVSDTPAAAIVEYAAANGINLIVMGTHGRSAVSQVFIGSVAERVVRDAPCPVLTVRYPEHEFVVPDTAERNSGHDCPPQDSRRD